MSFPIMALSVRQPWAWAIIESGIRKGDHKDVENRAWTSRNPGRKFRGRVAIHAAKGLTRHEYESFCLFYGSLSRKTLQTYRPVPAACDLKRGGIIGSVEIYDCVTKSNSPWFFGPVGLLLRDPEPCEFIPSVGQLGFWPWEPADESIVPAPAKWMLPKGGLIDALGI